MTAEGTELQFILDSVARLGKEVEEAEPGDPELAVIVTTVADLQRRLERLRGLMPAPFVASAGREPSPDEKTAASLERALASLLRAAEARRSVD